MLERILMNLEGGSALRTEQWNGREHLVVPTVTITEGVHPGNEGPVLYLNEDLADDPASWDHIPAVMNHPSPRNGRVPTARDPYHLEVRGVGVLFNSSHSESKSRTEVWLDVEKANRCDARLVTALRNGQKVEVSTGMRADRVGPPGVWNGQPYQFRAKNIRPDHLAILLDGQGACSVEKGAGMLANAEKVYVGQEEVVPLIANAQSYSDIEITVRNLLHAKFDKPGYDWCGYVVDVYEGFVIYRQEGGLFRQTFKKEGDVITLDGEPSAVVRVTTYQNVSDRSYVANASGKFLTNEDLKMAFDSKAHIDALITNGHFTEEDRPELVKMSEKTLSKLGVQKVEKKEPEPVQVQNAQQTPAAPKVQSEAEWLATAPPSVRQRFDRIAQTEKAEKDRLIANVLTSPVKPFTEAYLKDEARTLEELMGLSAMADAAKQQDPANIQNGSSVLNPGFGNAPYYAGAAGGYAPQIQNSNGQITEEPLAPFKAIDWNKK